MAAKFLMSRDASGKLYFVLKAGNGQVILYGSKFALPHECLAAIESVRRCAMREDRWQRQETPDGRFHFEILSDAGEVIGLSRSYSSDVTLGAGLTSVWQCARVARLIDYS
jgi:uncharacterized protein